MRYIFTPFNAKKFLPPPNSAYSRNNEKQEGKPQSGPNSGNYNNKAERMTKAR